MALSDRIVVMNRGRAEHVARPTEIYRAPATAFVANFWARSTCCRRHFNGVAASALSQWLAARQTAWRMTCRKRPSADRRTWPSEPLEMSPAAR